MAEYSRMAKGSFTNTAVSSVAPTSAFVALPFTPDYVELWNYTNIKTAGTHAITRAWWDSKLMDGNNNPTMVELYSGSSTSSVFDEIANTNAQPGINAFSAGQLLQYGPSQQIVSATAANPAVFTVTAHGYNVGDTVLLEGLYQSSTTGMPQIAGIPFTISAVTANTFTIKWDASGSNYTALSGSPVGSVVKKILYPDIYFPGASPISFLTLAATTTVVTTKSHQMHIGQEVAFRIPNTWGTTQLNSLPNNIIPGSPMYGYVISITDQWTFVVNINSAAYTAFVPNQTVSGTNGRSPAQVVAAGDVNNGANQISNGSPLYPPPKWSLNGLDSNTTINGPAIIGSFVNNTYQGFTIGNGLATADGTATILSGTTTNIIYWHAYLHDVGNP
jgi:hypothetical protein